MKTLPLLRKVLFIGLCCLSITTFLYVNQQRILPFITKSLPESSIKNDTVATERLRLLPEMDFIRDLIDRGKEVFFNSF